MKEQIQRCIEYLKSISLSEPTDFRVEEIVGQQIVLSYREKPEYMYSERLYKVFEWENARGEVVSIKSYKP